MSEALSADAGRAGTPEQTQAAGRRWMALIVLCVGQLMIVLDVTVVNVALPTVQRELHFSQTSLAWVVNASRAFGGLAVRRPAGDLVGRKAFPRGVGRSSSRRSCAALEHPRRVVIALRAGNIRGADGVDDPASRDHVLRRRAGASNGRLRFVASSEDRSACCSEAC
jgi:hypothetical protein